MRLFFSMERLRFTGIEWKKEQRKELACMISPYALLNASRPKSPSSIITAYDLYSAVQGRPDVQPQPSVPASTSKPVPEPAPPAAFPRLQGSRTHYIRDIGIRHSRAANRATFSAPPSD